VLPLLSSLSLASVVAVVFFSLFFIAILANDKLNRNLRSYKKKKQKNKGEEEEEEGGGGRK